MGYKQRAKVEYANDYLTSPDAEWELVAHTDECIVLEGINFLGDELWLLDVGLGRILKAVEGKIETIYESKDAHPNGMRPIDDHTLLVVDRALGVCTFDTLTGEYVSHCTGTSEGRFGHLDDLALDGQGGAYMTDPGESNCLNRNGSIYYVRYGDGSYECERYVTGIAYPNGIALSPDGVYVYIAEFDTNSIICVPSKLYNDDKDTPYVLARLVGGLGPDGIITDTRGNIYAAHLHAGEIAVVDPKGWPVGELRLPEGEGLMNANLCIHDGYLYTCEFSHGNIWRIPVNTEQCWL